MIRRLFPTSLKARLALVGMLATAYIFISTVYLGHGGNPFYSMREGDGNTIAETLPVHDLELEGLAGTRNGTVATSAQAAAGQTESKDIPSSDTYAAPKATNSPISTPNTSTGVASDSDSGARPKGPSVLLVSAFFPLEKPRYPQSKYDAWLKNYLGSITTDVYMYTTPEIAPQFSAMRTEGLAITLDTNYTTPFDVPPLQGKEEMYMRIQKKDRERRGGRRGANVTDLYAVRNAKLFFLHHAIEVQQARGVKYDYAFWNDAGSFRSDEHAYRAWPAPEKVQEVLGQGGHDHDVIFVPIFDVPHSSMAMWTEAMGPIDSKFSEGSFFGGSLKAIDWLTRAFYAYHNRYLALEIFVGKDTSLLNSLMFLFPDRFVTVWHNDPDAPTAAHITPEPPSANSDQDPPRFLGQCGSIWHYYQFFLSDAPTKEKMRDLWMQIATRWRWWGWWKSVDRTRCQDTRVLDVKSVLQRKLGAGWNAPGQGVSIPDRVIWT
ncbi:hypothetical protein JR316_0002704 [Psilocybe cubensis]|uniref:Uncharacterized protein n=2 Tax=Psilocybe cubensis TaxID=181762 RepID=A0A8H7Y8R5_PSICU|nr:hypothetical protein JR316_0002704 [Psilocybe cubensis]KAH9485789.1 hypothetical protein JR316_0002704 [Psilocybe cubensis]